MVYVVWLCTAVNSYGDCTVTVLHMTAPESVVAVLNAGFLLQFEGTDSCSFRLLPFPLLLVHAGSARSGAGRLAAALPGRRTQQVSFYALHQQGTKVFIFDPAKSLSF
jgi:hypothetical protein